MYLHSYHANFELNYTVLRYGNVYGPRQDPLGEAGVIAIFFGKILKNEIPTIYGDGNQLRDYIYVGDVARANLIALTQGKNKVYNIGTGVGVSVNELFEHLKALFEIDRKARYAPARKGELLRSILNCQKIKRELNWEAKIDIRQGLKLTRKWYK